MRRIRKKNFVSLIIPTYKQERTIRKDLRRIKKVMDQIRYEYEIIVVVDGELDSTRFHAQKIKSSKIRITGYKKNHGKGYAVRFGMAKARGEVVAFIDSGMDINPNGLSMLLEHFEWYKADVIVGSKLHPASKIHYPLQRKILSWGYRQFVKILFGLQVKDTQAGIKFFRRQVLEDVLPRLTIKSYAFDIELLAVAHSLGYKRIYEAPIELDFTGFSTITSKNFWETIGKMLLDTMIVFYRLKIVRYYQHYKKKSARLRNAALTRNSRYHRIVLRNN